MKSCHGMRGEIVLTTWWEVPLLICGVAGLVLLTWALVLGRQEKIAARAHRMGVMGMWLAFGAMVVMFIVDLSSFYLRGTGVIVGFYWSVFTLIWFVVAVTPTGIKTSRIRRENGWPPEYVPKHD